jgi:hypothetical protein
MFRKVIQIAPMRSGNLVALCDDGTIWQGYQKSSNHRVDWIYVSNRGITAPGNGLTIADLEAEQQAREQAYDQPTYDWPIPSRAPIPTAILGDAPADMIGSAVQSAKHNWRPGDHDIEKTKQAIRDAFEAREKSASNRKGE